MRCTKAREFISLDLDGQLPPDRAAGLTCHLDACGECRGYREDLAAGRRLLAAGEPQLSENFEWRLQLRLNQTLARAAAQAIHPWQDGRAERGAWWRNFGAASAVGLAAVLAVAMMAGPAETWRACSRRTASCAPRFCRCSASCGACRPSLTPCGPRP